MHIEGTITAIQRNHVGNMQSAPFLNSLKCIRFQYVSEGHENSLRHHRMLNKLLGIRETQGLKMGGVRIADIKLKAEKTITEKKK